MVKDEWYNSLPSGVQNVLKEKGVFNIEAAKKIKKIYLDALNLSDISFITAFEKLEVLRLSCNKISDLSPLSNLVGLKELGLYSNKISNLTPLSNLLELGKLWLSDNQISDITPLLSLVGLKELWLKYNPIQESNFLTHKSCEKDREIFAFNNGNVYIFGCRIIQKEEFIAQVNDKYGDMADYSPEYKERFM